MIYGIDGEFLTTPTALEDFTELEKEAYGCGETFKLVMLSTVKSMNELLSRNPILTWDVLIKVYTQWFELDHIDIEGKVAMFDEFCEATKAILAHPLDITNPQEFIRTVTFMERLNESQQSSEIIQQFQRYLPRIPQETIDAAKDVWKKQITGHSLDTDSDNPNIFFNRETDSEGRYPDLTCLDYFYKKATDDAEITKWHQRLSLWIPKWCGVI